MLLLVLVVIGTSRGWLWYEEDTTKNVKPDTTATITTTSTDTTDTTTATTTTTTTITRAESLLAVAPKWTPPPNAGYYPTLSRDSISVYAPLHHYMPLPPDTDFSDLPIIDADKMPEPLVRFLMYPTPENAKRWLLFYNRVRLRAEKMAQSLQQAAQELGLFLSPSDEYGAMAYAKFDRQMRLSYSDSIRENYILLYFFTPSKECVYCVLGLNTANTAYENGFVVIGLYPSSQRSEIGQFLSANNVKFPVQADDNGLADLIGIKRFPAFVAFKRHAGTTKDAFTIIAEGTLSYQDLVKQLVKLYFEQGGR